MNNYIMAYGRPVNCFIKQFGRSIQTLYQIPNYYPVEAHAYEEYAPGQLVFSWHKNGRLIGDAGVMFEVLDHQHRLAYYPVYPLRIAKLLLQKWGMILPPKWSVYAPTTKAKDSAVHPINRQMRNLLAYARLFVSMQNRFSTPMPYGFKEIFEQLHDYPEQAIDGSVVSLINKVISQYVCLESTVFNCKNLREFIIYLHNRYPSMKFVDSDFSNLHSMLKEEEPGMRCYF